MIWLKADRLTAQKEGPGWFARRVYCFTFRERLGFEVPADSLWCRLHHQGQTLQFVL
jgi:hypothetical protein